MALSESHKVPISIDCVQALVTLALSAAALPAIAQETYPVKPVRLLVGFSPGGGQDIAARLLSKHLTTSWGQPVVVENRAGANGIIAAEAVANAPPDGYTLHLFTANDTVNAGVRAKMPYDTLRDLALVTTVASAPYLLGVHPALPAKNVRELIALARTKPGQLSYASSGTGGLIHLTGALFGQMAKINIVHVPYKGTALFLPDLLNGQIAMSLDTLPPHLPFIRIGKLRALAVTTVKRSPVLPDLPTMAEAALPGFESVAIYALLAPTGTPRDIVTYLNRETNAVLQIPDVREKLAAQGIETLGGTADVVEPIIRNEVAKWARVIKDGGITPE